MGLGHAVVAGQARELALHLGRRIHHAFQIGDFTLVLGDRTPQRGDFDFGLIELQLDVLIHRVGVQRADCARPGTAAIDVLHFPLFARFQFRDRTAQRDHLRMLVGVAQQ